MKIQEIKPRMVVLEARQDEKDKDYGSCTWAKFYLNLDAFELLICSDCGNYGYRWCADRKETFLDLLARMDKHYLIHKIYGEKDVFDYEATKKAIVENYDDPVDEEILNQIFTDIELDWTPRDSNEFYRMFEDAKYEHDMDYDIDGLVKYKYPADALRIVKIFMKYVQPKIREILKGEQNA